MNNDAPIKAFMVVVVVAVVCSVLVSSTVVVLRPIQLNNQLLERSKNVMGLTGLLEKESKPSDDEILALFKSLDVRIVNIDEATFDSELNVDAFNQRRAVNNPELSVAIPNKNDLASLGRRSRYTTIYLVWQDDKFERIILPIHGSAMWSTLYGFLALESDLNTIAAATFYEHGETPGLGDQITRPNWLAQWQGRKIYDEQGTLRFAVGAGRAQAGAPAALYEVDALTGATVTADAVTSLVHYWLGPHGYQPFLDQLRKHAPTQAEDL